MQKQNRVARLIGSVPARTGIFVLFVLLAGSFAYWALGVRADLAAAYEAQARLAQQGKELGAAGSLNDFYDQGWLADEQNFSRLAGYADQLIGFAASRTLDPQFRQELGDYLLRNQARLPQESSRIASLSFSDGILKQDQARLLDLYDELHTVLRTMQEILSHWDQDTPLDRIATMNAFRDELATASMYFQATRSSHRKILDYAGQLGAQSQQASETGGDRVRADRRQITLAIAGLIASLLLCAGWTVFLVRARRSKAEERG